MSEIGIKDKGSVELPTILPGGKATEVGAAVRGGEAKTPLGHSDVDTLGPELQGDARKIHLTRVRQSAEITELLKRAKAAYARDSVLEPEQIALQLLRDRGIKISPDAEKELLDSAKVNAGTAGTGMSERTQTLLVIASLQAGAKLPSLEHVLSALTATHEPYAAKVRSAVADAVVDGVVAEKTAQGAAAAKQEFKDLSRQLPTLTGFATDLVREAAEGMLKRAVARNREVEQLLINLQKTELSSMVLTGERGVGKTAIVEGLALKIAKGEVPEHMKNMRIFSLSAADLCGAPGPIGAPSNPKDLLQKIASEAESALSLNPPITVVLFIDEIHQLKSNMQASSQDIGNALKPFMARGKLKLIGATTRDEYKQHIEPDGALADRLQEYYVKEATPEQAAEMLLANLDRLSERQGVEVDAGAVTAAVELARHNSKMRMPRGAYDFLDLAVATVKHQLSGEPTQLAQLRDALIDVTRGLEACHGSDPDSEKVRSDLSARKEKLAADYKHASDLGKKEKGLLDRLQSSCRLLDEELDQTNSNPDEVARLRREIDGIRAELKALPERMYHLTVDAAAVASAVAEWKGVPLAKLSVAERKKYEDVIADLSKKVIGQETAKEAIAQAVLLDRNGMRRGNKPVGVHFFAGPSGVGKTEIAKALAESCYNGNFIHKKLSQYTQAHEVTALLQGAPPGYVGHDIGSPLSEDIRKCGGKAVLLLDEIEKAHPIIFTFLMQLFDEGVFVDNKGQDIDCTGLHIIMTSNLGSREGVFDACKDGTYVDPARVRQEFTAVYNRVVPPECQNRLSDDEPVIFNPLGRAELRQVFAIKWKQMVADMAAGKHRYVGVTDAAREAILQEGFTPQFGARPLERSINGKVLTPLVRQLGAEGFGEGAYLTVDVDNKGEIIFRPMTLEEQAAHQQKVGASAVRLDEIKPNDISDAPAPTGRVVAGEGGQSGAPAQQG